MVSLGFVTIAGMVLQAFSIFVVYWIIYKFYFRFANFFVLITFLLYVFVTVCWSIILRSFYEKGWDWNYGYAYYSLGFAWLIQLIAFIQGRYYTRKMLLSNDIVNFADIDDDLMKSSEIDSMDTDEDEEHQSSNHKSSNRLTMQVDLTSDDISIDGISSNEKNSVIKSRFSLNLQEGSGN